MVETVRSELSTSTDASAASVGPHLLLGRPTPGFGEEPRNPWVLTDQTTGAQRPVLPFLSRTNRLRAEGGRLARRPERCNPGYRPGRAKRRSREALPLNDGGENHPGATPGTSTDASAASVGPHLFLGRPHTPGEKSGIPDLDRTNDGGALRPRSCSLPSFGQRPVMHRVGGPPDPYASLFIRTK
jgi:hypothetical protein